MSLVEAVQMTRMTKTFDANLVLKDAGAITASAAAQVAVLGVETDKILDLGDGLVEADIVIDISAMELTSQDEEYIIGVQLSNSATFAADNYEMARIPLGAAGVNFFTEVDQITGYTTHKVTPVAGADAIAGYATIGNTGVLGNYPSGTAWGATNGTYTLDITRDGGSVMHVATALLATDTWAGVCTKIQAALRTADGAHADLVAISGNFIRITSYTTGTSSSILIAAGSTGTDLLTTINGLGANYVTSLPTPVAGINATHGYAEISNTGSLGAYTGATVLGLTTRNYDMDITIDGGSVLKLVLSLTDAMTWTQICTAIQIALRAADGAKAHTVAIVGNNIRVTSVSTGASSAVLIANGTFGSGSSLFGDANLGIGRYIVPFNNYTVSGITKRYLRLYCTISGTITTGINYTAYLAKRS